MEVDSSRKRTGPKVYYRCRQPGHFARDCKSKFDSNPMDYTSLRAHILKEAEEEAKVKDDQETKDLDSGERHVPAV
jgi:Zinc knuckle